MKVFVAGATGVIGRRAVAELVAAGHTVTGVARTTEKAQLLASLGATPVEVDLFDADAVRGAAAGHDAVVNLATHIPTMRQIARPSAWAENERIRTEASRNLAAAAADAGASVYIQESIAFAYDEYGDSWVDEDTPLADGVHTKALAAAESAAATFQESGGRGVVLRFGRFLDPESDQTAMFVRMASWGIFGEPGPGDVYQPTIHVGDAARAVVAALDAPGGTYNVVNETQNRSEHRRALGEAVGRRLVAPPKFLARLGGSALAHALRSQRPSNGRFRATTGWEPRYPDANSVWRAVADALGAHRPPAPATVRIVLWILLISGLAVGAQATFTPATFYTDFPFGRGWVELDGPYNEHLVRDFGAMNLALAALATIALWSRSRAWVRATGIAWVVYSVPHLVYHLGHLGPYETGDAVANVVLLTGGVVFGALVLTHPLGRQPVPRDPENLGGVDRGEVVRAPA